jgi:PAS domain S-box-containing protein
VVLAVSRTPSGNVVVEVEPEGRPAAVAVGRAGRPALAAAVRRHRARICVVTLDGYVLEANRVLLAMLDRPAEEVVGARFHEFSAPDDRTRLDRERLLRTGHATMEKRYRRGDGRELWLRVAPASSSRTASTGSCRSARTSPRRAAPRAARPPRRPRRAHRPAQPGAPAPAPAGLLEDVRGAAATAWGCSSSTSTGFKVINDSLGHAAGDRLLREVAAAAAQHAPDDLLARLGGDEFALVTRDHRDAAALAQRLVEVLEAPFDWTGAR